MNFFKCLPAILALAVLSSSCSSENEVKAVSTITVVNVMANAKPIIPSLTNGPLTPYTIAKTIAYGAAFSFTTGSGEVPMYVVQNSDTSRALFQGGFTLAPGSISTLYLIGDTTRPDTLFTSDAIPFYTDSTAGIRFVHASPASQPVSVNIKGAAPKELTDLGYKQLTGFKPYRVTPTANSRIFEIRNQANDSLLVSYTWNPAPNRNYTVVFTGNWTDKTPTALRVFALNNF
ncbi:DUF4397 domain-containing protein [Chitinophaga horti]|uniref:DUF4397 domain-containing protein n=1 Tax=Chitinophaga horti TaxID=2920382 RepID=A0ABY6J6F3_9BACT|nr:DUF4397 domain-containing protein [Chitinophaga horti]UYQ93827.1 DUF4397 domain-containing protein [Chitinophaga horti]